MALQTEIVCGDKGWAEQRLGNDAQRIGGGETVPQLESSHSCTGSKPETTTLYFKGCVTGYAVLL